MKNDEKRLAEIRQRSEQATPGPWHAVNEYSEVHDKLMGRSENGTLTGDRPCGIADIGYINRQANAEYIAHSRADIPLLLDAYDQMRHERDNAYRDGGHDALFQLCKEMDIRFPAAGSIEELVLKVARVIWEVTA